MLTAQFVRPLFLAAFLLLATNPILAAQDPTDPSAPPAAADHSNHKPAPSPAATVTGTDHSAHSGTAAATPDGSIHAHQVPAETAALPAPGHDITQMNKQNEAVAALIKELQDGMAAIKAASGPAERKRLLLAQLATLSKGVALLKDSGCGAMMQAGKCPMMQAGPSGHHGAMMGDGKAGMMDMGGMMAMCGQMKQQHAELLAGLLEQIVEVQTRLVETAN